MVDFFAFLTRVTTMTAPTTTPPYDYDVNPIVGFTIGFPSPPHHYPSPGSVVMVT